MKLIKKSKKYNLYLTKKEWEQIGKQLKFAQMSDENPRKNFNDIVEKIRDVYNKGVIEEGRDYTYNYELESSDTVEGTKYIQVNYDYWSKTIKIEKYYENEQMQNYYGEIFSFTVENEELVNETDKILTIITNKINEFLG